MRLADLENRFSRENVDIFDDYDDVEPSETKSTDLTDRLLFAAHLVLYVVFLAFIVHLLSKCQLYHPLTMEYHSNTLTRTQVSSCCKKGTYFA